MAQVSQCDRIVKYMQDFGSITQLDALREFGCMRLASRISDLKKNGYAIKTVMEKAKNKYGEAVSYARYSLAE